MSRYTLITGASKGIGKDFAEVFAENQHNLILVARSADKLQSLAEDLKSKYGIAVEPISQDLGQANSAHQLFEQVVSKNLDVQYLVNNAGFGWMGEMSTMPMEKCESMLHLNMTTLTLLCRLFSEKMVENKEGGILNVASTAAFQPGPYMSLYYASKAFVLSFSEGLHNELENRGVAVSALCPGPTKTQFFKGAELEGTRLAQLPMTMESASVARLGYQGLMDNKAVVIPGWSNWALALTNRLTPRSLIRKVTSRLHQSVD